MRAGGYFYAHQKHPHPLDAKQPAREGNTPGGKRPDHCVTTAPTPTPQPLPATGQGREPSARRGMHGAREPLKSTTRRTLHRCNDVEHNSKHDKVYEHNSVRAAAMKQASNNGVEHSTHGDAGTLSSAAQQRNAKNLQRCKRQPTRQGDASTTAKRHDNATRRTFSINNTMQQGCDSTGEQSASHKPTFTKASTR